MIRLIIVVCIVSLITISCSVRTQPGIKPSGNQYTEKKKKIIKSMNMDSLHATYKGNFLGLGVGIAKTENEAAEIAKMNALAELTQSVSVSIMKVSRSVIIDEQSGNQSYRMEDFENILVRISKTKLREPQFRRLEIIHSRKGYGVTMLALKNRKEYFEDYADFNPTVDPQKILNIFDRYYKNNKGY